MTTTGTEIGKQLLAAKEAQWQPIILGHALAGNTPTWARSMALWPWVNVKATIDGKQRTLSYQVSPNYFAVGSDEDPLIVPPTPAVAQRIADKIGATMISRKMVRDIEDGPSNAVRLQYETLGLPNTAPSAWIRSNAAIWKKTPSALLLSGGAKKNVVVGPNLDGSHVAIFGAFGCKPKPGGGFDQRNCVEDRAAMYSFPFTQSYNPTGHEAAYFDHSHGLRLASRKALLDGVATDLRGIALDPKLSVLVSDQGPFPLTFPSSRTFQPTSTGPIDTSEPQADGPLFVESGPLEDGERSPFPIVPVAVGAVAIGLLIATLRMTPSRA